METDRLNELLKNADVAAPPPAIDPDLTRRVRRKAARQRRTRASVSVAAVTVMGAMLTIQFLRAHPMPPKIAPAVGGIAQLKLELAKLSAEAAMHENTAHELQHLLAGADQERRQEKVLTEPDPLQHLAEARNRAALILVRQAERDAMDSGQSSENSESHDIYRRAARLFGDTPAGQEAARRLQRQNPRA